MFSLRIALSFAMASPLLFCAGALHAADTYPSKPGRLILPFGAGASTDIIGRIFAQHFSEAWGQTLVVDNRHRARVARPEAALFRQRRRSGADHPR